MEKGSIRILLVEDNPGDARLLREALAEEKAFAYQLEIVERLSDCLSRLSRGNIDLLLLDLFLPDSSGLETLTRLRRDFPQIPIVVMTGLDDRETAVQSLKEGAQDFLPKEKLDHELLSRAISYALERNRLRVKIEEKEERYHLAAMGSQDGLWDWDLKENRIYFSPRWKLMLGFQDYEIGDRPDEWWNRVHPEDLPQVRKDLAEHLAGRTAHFISEHRLQHRDGSWRWVLSRGLAIFDGRRQAVRMAGSFTDITSQKNLEQSLAQRAFYDPLTELPNRRLFMENLERSLARAQHPPGHFFAVMFLDLDRLKFVNDSLGHSAGDQLLVEFTRRMRSCLRPHDLMARMGGDEFTVLLDDLTGPEEAVAIAERILAALKIPFIIAGGQALTTASIGIAYSDCGKSSADEIIQAADRAMYQAKMLGKARYEIFNEAMGQDAPQFLQLEADLRQAIHKGEFLNLYEPILNLPTGRLAGAQVKLRWNHPRRGLLTPKDFIPLAEEIGFLGAIDFFMLKTACLQTKIWQTLGYPDFFISAGFSSRQLQRDVVVRMIRALLEESGLKPPSLEIQVPGFLIFQEALLIPEPVRELGRTGARVALSHFSSGFSGLKDIKDSPIGNIRVDREFIQPILQDPTDDSLVKMIVAACHGLKMKVTAKGVDSPLQMELLRKNGWDDLQGPVFSPPLAADHFTKLLTDPRRMTA